MTSDTDKPMSKSMKRILINILIGIGLFWTCVIGLGIYLATK